MHNESKKIVAEALFSLIEKARNGGPVIRIGLMAQGSELGQDELLQGALVAQRENAHLQVVAIGPKPPAPTADYNTLEWIETPDCEADIAQAVANALDNGTIAGAVALHYPFPVGVTTVGKVISPGRGKPVFIASCTGTSSSNRAESLLRNAVYGIAVAKACGIAEPSVAFLNLDGAGVALRALGRLANNGYAVNLGSSSRGEGGALLRGNDIVAGSTDVIVCDTLTGNVLVKVFSTYTAGGLYEAAGFGYGPSVGEHWEKIVCIISRASGAPVVANALQYAARAVQGTLQTVVATELQAARKAGFDAELAALAPKQSAVSEVQKPKTVPVDDEIHGVDVLDMDAAAQALWKEGIYAETAMGCTGPVVRVQSALKEKAQGILKGNGFI